MPKEENIQNKIKEIVNSFAKIERDNEGKHLWASIDPKKNKINNSQFKHFDTLARLFANAQEEHVAVYYNGEKLMIASGKAKPEAAKETLRVLNKFAADPSERYKELVKLAIRNIHLWSEKDTESSTIPGEPLNAFNSFKSLIQEYHEKIIKNQEELTQEKLTKLQNCAKELFQEIKRLEDNQKETRDFMWDYLVPFDDVNIITNAFQEKDLSEEITKAIKNPNELIDFIEGEENMHPEMKIIDKLCQAGFKPEFPYLGSSKLACMPCHFAVMVVNETRFDGKLLIAGTHGSTYPNWIMPTNFSLSEQQKLFEKIEQCRHRTINFNLWFLEARVRQN